MFTLSISCGTEKANPPFMAVQSVGGNPDSQREHLLQLSRSIRVHPAQRTCPQPERYCSGSA